MENVRKMLLIGWTLALMLLRPSILGEHYNQLVFVVFFLVTILILSNQRQGFRLSRERFTAILLIYLCLSYFLVQGMILSEAKETVINASMFLLLTTPCIALILNRHQERILKIFINVHYYLSISALITFIIFALRGFSIYKLPVLASLFDIVQYATFDPVRPLSNHILVFPFTVMWSTVDFMGLSFPRFVGIYREPGMSQIFFITAFILTYFQPVKHVIKKRILLLIGTALLFSAAGIINLALSILVYIFMNTSIKGNLITLAKKPVFFALLIIAFVVLTKVGIEMTQDKLANVSGETRIDSFKNGLEKLKENPIFGKGYYNAFERGELGATVLANNIGLIGISFQIGIVGLLMYCICWAYSLTRLASSRTLAIYIPCVMTLLFSQPSYNDAIVWFLLLLNTRELSSNHLGHHQKFRLVPNAG